MSSPSFNQDKELAEFFTDVEHLREAFKNAVAAPMLTKRLFVIHGVGGVGKSSLLRMLRLHCKGVNVPVALASGDEAKSAFGILVRWTEDLKADHVAFPTFGKTYGHYRELQAKVEVEAGKIAGQAVKGAAKTVIETAASTIPGVGPLLGKLGGSSVEALADILLSRGFKRPDIDLLLDPTKKLADDFLVDLAKSADKQRMALLLDTFEQMTALEDWARDIAQRLSTNVLFVIAGRALPDWSRAWDSWQKNAYVEELKPMTEDVMRQLIQRYYATMRGGQPDPKQIEAIVAFARGLPMVVTSAVQLWVKYGVEDFQTVKAEIVANLVDRLMEGVPSALIPALEAAAIVRWFDQPILRAVMKQDDVREAYNELRHFPFVRVRVEGLALHDAVREMMDENLRAQDSERHRTLHERAAAYFETRLEKATGEEAERLELERLYHHVRVDEEAGIQVFQEMAEELARYRLTNRLRALLNDVNTYPLNLANSRLWRQYYAVRLIHAVGQLAEAEPLYQMIGENRQAEPKLRAYALSDWGDILSTAERLYQPGGPERAIQTIQASLELGKDIDFKLVLNYHILSTIYVTIGDSEKLWPCFEKAIEFFKSQQNKIGLIYTYRAIKGAYGRLHDWQQVFNAQAMIERFLEDLSESDYLRAWTVGYFLIAWVWAGRLSEAERHATEALAIRRQVEGAADFELDGLLRDQGTALALQNRLTDAFPLFEEALAMNQRLNDRLGQAATLYLFGAAVLRSGDLAKSEELIRQSIQVKNDINARLYEPLNYLGLLLECQSQWDEAESIYRQRLAFNFWGRFWLKCGALTGLIRVKHAQADYAAIPSLLTDAEQLAQQYEYNDHLASLRLTQGHIAWEGKAPTWDNGFEAALRFYQHALIYALRYNRFLLDEALSGRPQGTPLRPIIPQCLERGEEGRQMLTALRDWWQTGLNDIGTPRPDTISPIPEGIPLLEAECIAREREPGDGLPQKSVIGQIEAALM